MDGEACGLELVAQAAYLTVCLLGFNQPIQPDFGPLAMPYRCNALSCALRSMDIRSASQLFVTVTVGQGLNA